MTSQTAFTNERIETTETRDAITALASNVEIIMSTLYVLHSAVLSKRHYRRNVRVELIKKTRNGFGKCCEALSPFLQHCHAIINDFIFLAPVASERRDMDEAMTGFVKGILARMDEVIAEAANLITGFRSLGQNFLREREVRSLLQDMGRSRHTRQDHLQKAEACLKSVITSLTRLETSWREDKSVLQALLTASHHPRSLGSVSSWKKYQQVVADAESSIIRSVDALQVDPPPNMTPYYPRSTLGYIAPLLITDSHAVQGSDPPLPRGVTIALGDSGHIPLGRDGQVGEVPRCNCIIM